MDKPADIEKRNPFKVPDNYFDKLGDRLTGIVSAEERKVKPVTLYRKLRPYLAVAASVLILFAIGYTALKKDHSGQSMLQVPELSLQQYYEMLVNEIDLMTLEENIDHEIFSGGMPEVNSDEIIEYLLLENIDENEIYELL
jgi:hypothetical protein